jgi:hypothetical protein
MGRAPERRGASVAPFLLVLGAVASGCAGGPDPPRALLDGSVARPPAVELEGISHPVVVAKAVARKVAAVPARPRIASCLHEGWSERPTGVAVLRIGAFGTSVTFRGGSGRSLLSCDGAGGHVGPPWCGHSFARLMRGRLGDPRLDLGPCLTREGAPVAFAWIQPGPNTGYVVVAQPGFSEAYPTASRMPVRVATTSGLDLGRLAVTIAVSEHSAGGRELRSYELEARIAG